MTLVLKREIYGSKHMAELIQSDHLKLQSTSLSELFFKGEIVDKHLAVPAG